MRSLLSAPDDFGTRWSYDRTIRVAREANFTYVVDDQIARTITRKRTLPEGRLIVQQALALRPQIDWRRSWRRLGYPTRVGTSWQRDTPDGSTAIWITRLPGHWWSIEIIADRNTEGGVRTYNWRIEGHHPIGVVQAQALAWATHRATTRAIEFANEEGSPR